MEGQYTALLWSDACSSPQASFPTFTRTRRYVALNCRLIDAQTGRIFGAAQTRIVKDDDVRKIMGAALPTSEREGDRVPAPRPEPASRPKPVLQQQRAGSVLFELKGCSLAGKLVKCEFLVTNSGEDSDLSLTVEDSARLFDDEGNEYHAQEAVLGSSKSNGRYFPARTRLTSGIPVRARLSFDSIPPETQRAILLELRIGQDWVQFRNVPLARP